MSLPTLNGTARLIDDPELRYAASGGAVVKIRLAFNSRKKDQSGQWVDDAVFYVRGVAFGKTAENIAETLQRGVEVTVSGRMKTESWESNGEKREAPSLLVDSIGPSLRSATAKVTKASSSGGGRPADQGARQQQGSGDPWGAAAQQAGQAGGSGWDDSPPF